MVTSKGWAFVVAEAATPNHKVGGSGVRMDFSLLIRHLNEAVSELGEGKVEYSLMAVESSRLIILKDLSEYYVIIESKVEPDEKLFLTTVEHMLTVVKDITKPTRPQN